MCRVKQTLYLRCQCLRDQIIVAPCAAAFSSLGFSCCGKSNENVVETLTSDEPYCRRCFSLKNDEVLESYTRLIEQVMNEGLNTRWPGLEIVKAMESLKKAEEEELAALRQQSGL